MQKNQNGFAEVTFPKKCIFGNPKDMIKTHKRGYIFYNIFDLNLLPPGAAAFGYYTFDDPFY